MYDYMITERYLTFTIHIIPTVTYIQSIQGYTFSSHANFTKVTKNLDDGISVYAT